MPALPSHHLSRRIAGPLPLPEPFSPSPRQLELHEFAKRQGTIAIPTLYQHQNDSPPPGAVVGIVLGSVLGFLLLVWLFSALTGRQMGATVAEEEIVVRSSHRSRSPQRKKSKRREMTSRSPKRERIIRQERIVRETTRTAPPRSSYTVEERIPVPDRDSENMVEVVEEESSIVSAPRRKSKRGSRYG